jgi:hypothetical protein
MKWWKLKEEHKLSRRGFLMRSLGMMEVMQTTCGWRWVLTLEKWPQRSSEWLKEASAKLKRYGDGMRMCKNLSWRRKSALVVCP